MNIILVRHGETAWNRAEIFRGRVDVELNETGLRQAELLGEYLRDVKVEAIYASPLKRALKTAQTIAQHQDSVNKVAVLERLTDLNLGKWEGLPRTEVAEKYKEVYNLWMTRPDTVTIPGGENLKQVRERAVPVIGDIIAKHKGTVVLVSHRVVCKVLTCYLLGLDDSHFWNIEQSNCGMTTFLYENGQFILTEHNNTCYLKPLQKEPVGDF